MIEPYTTVGLVPTFWGIRQRGDIRKNVDHLTSLTKAVFWLCILSEGRSLACASGWCQTGPC
jgi:hypothetical protein